ncbi:hypothetical protein QAD02_015011 [Eretmocerus hayati]|uniref:Uncharacterized protein n=1 Tax=Eretmocerus hayati TaxID=131215 RepID=A0ACC2P6K8_9HYME|nr:hypothetical protein QAD02_015011 [Eretmocerus hayati]
MISTREVKEREKQLNVVKCGAIDDDDGEAERARKDRKKEVYENQRTMELSNHENITNPPRMKNNLNSLVRKMAVAQFMLDNPSYAADTSKAKESVLLLTKVNSLEGPPVPISSIKRSWRRIAAYVAKLVTEGKEANFNKYYRLVIAAVRKRNEYKVKNMVSSIKLEASDLHSHHIPVCATSSKNVGLRKERPALGRIDPNVVPAKNLSFCDQVPPKEEPSLGTDPKSRLLIALSNEIKECMIDISKDIDADLENMASMILRKFCSAVNDEISDGMKLVSSAIQDNSQKLNSRYDLMIQNLSESESNTNKTTLGAAEMDAIATTAAIKISSSFPI